LKQEDLRMQLYCLW